MPVLPETKKNLRILVTRADRIGDLVLSTPVFRALREKFPQSRIACLTFCGNREMVEGNPHLDEVILYDKKGSEKGVWGNLLFAWKLRRKNFDAVIHLHATNRMHWVGWLAGIPVRIGYSRKCAWALTQAIPDLKSEGKKHEAEYNFDLLKPLGVDAPAKLEPFFPLREKSAKSLDELCRRFEIPQGKPWIILSPSASCPSKIWPAERFGELAGAIAARHDVTFLAIGSLKDRPFVEKAAQNASVPIHDLSGRLSLGMLGHLLSRASLLISNDSGPVHIARAVGTPVISVFGRNQPGLSPARWRPLGEDSRVVWKDVGCAVCLAHNCEIGFLCLDAISVADVLREFEHLAKHFPLPFGNVQAAKMNAGWGGLHSASASFPISIGNEASDVPSDNENVYQKSNIAGDAGVFEMGGSTPGGGAHTEYSCGRTRNRKVRAKYSKKSLRRVLIVQPYGIGDMLFLTPVLRALRLVPTVEKVDLLLGSRNDAAVKNNPHIDEIFTVDKDLFRRRGRFQNLRSVLDLGRELRNRRYDLLLDYSLRGEYAFFGRFFLKIPRRAGFAYKNRAFFHNIRLPLPEGFRDRHVADHYCNLAEKAGVRVEDRFLEFYIDPLDRVTVSDRMSGTAGRILVVSPGGGESWGKDAPFRRWPVPFFAKLAGRIYRDYEFDRCVLIGGAGDKDLAAELAGQLEIPCFNLCGQLSLGETAALMEKASLVMVNDSGLVHLANSLRVPLIAFYGPVDPSIYGPYPVSSQTLAIVKEGLECRPCYQRFRYNSACPGRECLQQLTPEEAWISIETSGFLSGMAAKL